MRGCGRSRALAGDPWAGLAVGPAETGQAGFRGGNSVSRAAAAPAAAPHPRVQSCFVGSCLHGICMFAAEAHGPSETATTATPATLFNRAMRFNQRKKSQVHGFGIFPRIRQWFALFWSLMVFVVERGVCSHRLGIIFMMLAVVCTFW